MVQDPSITALCNQLYADDFSTARGAAESLAALADTEVRIIPLLFDVVLAGPEHSRMAAQFGIASVGLAHPLIQEHWVALMQRATSESRLAGLEILSYAEDCYNTEISYRSEPFCALFRAAIDDPLQAVRHLAASYFFDCIEIERLHEWVELLITVPDLGDLAETGCAEFLATAGAAIVPQVWALVHDPRPSMRRVILQLLMQTSAELVGDLFLFATHDPDEHVRVVAICYFGFVQMSQATEVLVTALDDPSVEVRFWAVRLLGIKGDRSTLAAIRHAATDSVVRVRCEAIDVLGYFKDLESIAAYAHDPSQEVRQHVTWVCARMQTSRAIPLLRSLAQDAAVPVRTGAASALVAIGAPEVLPILVLLARDVSVRVRLSVIQSLNVYSTFDRAMASVLVDMLSDDSDEEVRAGVAEYRASNKRV